MTSVVHNDTYPAIDSAQVDFSGKAVFISGATRGLGRAMSVAFARAGASQIAVGGRSDLGTTVAAMEAAAAAAGRPAPQIEAVRFDLTDAASVEGAARQVAAAFGGRVDVVVNNAGVLAAMAPIVAADPDAWMQNFAVNVRGPFLAARSFIPLLLRSDVRTMVTVCSVAALLATPGISGYQISKLAELRLSEFICAEHAQDGLLAYSIHPGNIPTDMIGGPEGVPPEMREGRCSPRLFSSFVLLEANRHVYAVFTETAELSADSLVYLTSKKRDWLAGRYINVTWDLPELMDKEKEIVAGDKLKVKLVV